MDISHSYLNPVKVLQKDVISTQKQPGCKKGEALFKMASVKKSCEIKGGGQEMAVMVWDDGKIVITTIQVNFVLIPGVMRQHNLTRIVVIKILPSTYAIPAISWPPPLISQLFSHWPF